MYFKFTRNVRHKNTSWLTHHHITTPSSQVGYHAPSSIPDPRVNSICPTCPYLRLSKVGSHITTPSSQMAISSSTNTGNSQKQKPLQIEEGNNDTREPDGHELDRDTWMQIMQCACPRNRKRLVLCLLSTHWSSVIRCFSFAAPQGLSVYKRPAKKKKHGPGLLHIWTMHPPKIRNCKTPLFDNFVKSLLANIWCFISDYQTNVTDFKSNQGQIAKAIFVEIIILMSWLDSLAAL